MKLKLPIFGAVALAAIAAGCAAAPVAHALAPQALSNSTTSLQGPKHQRYRGGMMKFLKQLNLSKAQSDKIHALMTQTRQKMMAIRKSNADQATKRKEMHDVFTNSHKQMMAILTPAQRVKFKQLMKAQRQGHKPPTNQKP